MKNRHSHKILPILLSSALLLSACLAGCDSNEAIQKAKDLTVRTASAAEEYISEKVDEHKKKKAAYNKEQKEEEKKHEKISVKDIEDQVCATKYPVLMVHGVFFRDTILMNYWGRIPGDLQDKGAIVYYGDQQSAASVDECGRELAERIKKICREKGCKKLNVIAHSKGGLDMRAAITKYEADKYVASLTTINTPHRGCMFADYLLNKAPKAVKKTVAKTYNTVVSKLGDEDPDFLDAVEDLTAENCADFNENCPDDPDVYYQSYGTYAPDAQSSDFPLNMTRNLVEYFDGERNDGLVAVSSMKWGSKFTLIEPKSEEGITHADVIDLYGNNVPGYDVREMYVDILRDLKSRGY